MVESYSKFEAKLQEKTRKLLEPIRKDFELNINNNDSKLLVSDINYILSKLYTIKEKVNFKNMLSN